jgi:hypothetical protein
MPSRLADQLVASRRARFVGRASALASFRAALAAAEPPFAVLFVHGPGGIGKTTLLHEYARLASEAGRPVVQIDGRGVDRVKAWLWQRELHGAPEEVPSAPASSELR